MHPADDSIPKRSAIFKVIDKLNVISPGPGITVIVNGVHKIGGEFLDEIAAAIIAIKMYIKSKNVKMKSRKVKNMMNKKDLNNGRGVLWFKSWLKEAMKEFDFNPYRRGVARNSFYSL